MLCQMCKGVALKASCGYAYKTYEGSDERHVIGAICRSCIEFIEKHGDNVVKNVSKLSFTDHRGVLLMATIGALS